MRPAVLSTISRNIVVSRPIAALGPTPLSMSSRNCATCWLRAAWLRALAASMSAHGLAASLHKSDRCQCQTDQQRHGDGRARQHGRPVAADELFQPIHPCRPPRFHRLIGQVALNIFRQAVGRLVAAIAIFFQARITIQSRSPDTSWLRRWRSTWRWAAMVALRFAQRANPRAGWWRVFFANDPAHFVEGRRAQTLLIERRGAGEQFVQQHAQRINVAARVDIHAGHLRLLGAHVHRRADHLREGGEQRLFRKLLARWPWQRRNR